MRTSGKNLRKLVNTTLNILQYILVATQKEALKSWFKDVLKNMEVVELKKDISR